MSEVSKFRLLRRILQELGLHKAAVDDIIDWIIELVAPDGTSESKINFSAYKLQDDFLSKAELDFFHVLEDVTRTTMIICPKVSLGDIFCAKTGDYAQNLSARNRIERKHVDFLLCHPVTMHPLRGVELDDKSHQREDRKERDRLVNGVFETAGLPLQRIPAQRSDDIDGLRDLLESVSIPSNLETAGSRSDDEMEIRTTSRPACPKCGAEMVLRNAKQGANKEKQFWGCPKCPRCRGIRKLD